MKDKIEVLGIAIYTNHGCMQEEALIGSKYVVDVWVTGDLRTSCLSDDLVDTIDYVHINRIVAEEMQQRSKLLEHVNLRIIKRLFAEIPPLETAKVKVTKLSPPINGDVASVSVILKRKRSEITAN
jgi:dihydroneopterin aldolase